MKRVLFVCTGNTCRSPMAQAVFNSQAKKNGVDAVSFSCGMYADGLSEISHNAKQVLKSAGISFDHVSIPLNDELLKNADYVFGMTKSHARSLIVAFPKYANKIYVSPVEITDPYGGNVETYQQCLSQIQKAVDIIISEVGVKNE